MTPQQGAAKLRLKATAVRKELTSALNDAAQVGVKLGRDNSSGPFSQAQLSAVGHPYSKRRPNPAYTPGIINVQTGRFKAAWKTIRAVRYSGGLRSRVVNRSPEAGFLTGFQRSASRMIRRPVDSQTMIDLFPYFLKRMQSAIGKAVKA